jgi:pimeloyl-ACP methyl ester carboxylesterase
MRDLTEQPDESVAATPPETLVWLLGLRWLVEQAIKEAKDELGLDHYEVRGWRGWHHHDPAGARLPRSAARPLPENAVDHDRMLTNVTLYWLTATAGSSAQLYYEGFHSGKWGEAREMSAAPTGVAVFPGDISIRRIAERENNIVHWSEFERGGHFAAMEAPDLLVSDVREFFGGVR